MSDDADFAIKINYSENEGSAARVFEIAADIIRAFELFDAAIITSISKKIETSLIIEDVEKSSLKVILRNILKGMDDDAIKNLDIKKLIGAYFLRAKYIALEWLDECPTTDSKKSVGDLTERIQKLAVETDARHLPDYPPANQARIAQSLDMLQGVKKKFHEGETLVITLGKDDYNVKTDVIWTPSDYVDEDLAERVLINSADMLLVIKKADLLGKSQWSFLYGKSTLQASIDDDEWLSEFHSGRHSIRPGDALHVRVEIEAHYDKDGILIDQKARIQRIYKIIHTTNKNEELFDE